MTRLFFALDINTAQKNTFTVFSDDYSSTNFKPVAANNYHVTLCFLGEVTKQQQSFLSTKAEEIARQLSPIKPAQLLIDQLGLFKKPKILYLSNSDSPDWLLKLATKLSTYAKSLNIFQENRPYLPHISIYRKATFLPSIVNKPNIELTINSFSLYQSISTVNGVSYRAIKTWTLV